MSTSFQASAVFLVSRAVGSKGLVRDRRPTRARSAVQDTKRFKSFDASKFKCRSVYILYLQSAWGLKVDRSNSSLNPGANKTPVFLNITGMNSYFSRLIVLNYFSDGFFQVFVDHSVVEIYSGDARNVASFRVYPTLSDALGVVLVAEDANVIFNVDAWVLGGQAVNGSSSIHSESYFQ